VHASWLEGERAPIDARTLSDEGVTYERVSLALEEREAAIEAFAQKHGYVARDEVALGPDTPNLEAICAKFVDEHLHTEDEVRLVLEGEGVFDIRSRDDRWMRVTVTPGDLIVVPRDRHHRFFLTDAKRIRCVRLFQDASGWVPHYRDLR
jgi:1,2-dihydroxy-3-keto-5-methylthiopentene dioxygenase